MPLWDSVHRGLEKASQEAARIARAQRLRATVDGLSRQMQLQNSLLINKAMELFIAGQLTQNELLPLCQALAQLQYQLNQAQIEMTQLAITPIGVMSGRQDKPSAECFCRNGEYQSSTGTQYPRDNFKHVALASR